VAAVKKEIESVAGITDLGNFVLYGELMCNKNLYDYAEKNLSSAWTVFGAMIKPITSAADVVEALHKANFSCALKGGQDSDDEDGKEVESSDLSVMLTMNGTFKSLIDKFGYPTVPYTGRYDSMYALVAENFNWLVKGMGEGIVISHERLNSDDRKNSAVSKWKNGTEENSVNTGLLDTLLEEIEAD